jgi:chloride channel 3/4/5
MFREYISREAEGSGLPDLKAVIAGVHMHGFFSLKALIGKFIGIVVGIGGASLSIGRQGGFIHITSIIAH